MQSYYYLRLINKDCFSQTLDYIYENFNKSLNKIIYKISMIDYIKSNAKCAVEFNYVAPLI